MRFAVRLGGILLLVAGLSSCDQTEVAQLESQGLGVRIFAPNALVELYNVWDLIEDNDDDGQPDDGMTWLYCEFIPVPPTAPPVTISPVSVPWKFSIQIDVLRAGGTEFETVSGTPYLDPNSNIAEYDTTVVSGFTPPKVPLTIDDGGTLRTFKFPNPRRLSSANRDVVEAITNPLYEFDPTTYGYLDGLCSVGDPGPSDIAGDEQPFDFDLGKGETLRVQARKSFTAPPEMVDAAGNSLILLEPALAGRMALDGKGINVRGDPSSTNAPGDGVIFFFTSR